MASREKQTDAQLLEERKVKALEKIANSIDLIFEKKLFLFFMFKYYNISY